MAKIGKKSKRLLEPEMEHRSAHMLRNFSSKSKNSLKIPKPTIIGSRPKNLRLKMQAQLCVILNAKQKLNIPTTSIKCIIFLI